MMIKPPPLPAQTSLQVQPSLQAQTPLQALAPAQQHMLLLQAPGVGVATFWKLVDHFARIEEVFCSGPSELHTLASCKVISAKVAAALIDIIEQQQDHPLYQKTLVDQQWLQHRGIRVITPVCDNYPELLKHVKQSPPLLYVWGDPKVLHLPQIAIVGSRKPSPGGRKHAHDFSQGLAAAGFVITSGLALGVDVAAHEGALAAKGRTLAVLGTSIDQIYPARHVAIAESIVAHGGAIISEFPLGTAAMRSNFPQRNRIISGLSCGVLVVEAAIKSGSLITARYALQQNREVFAIPGSIQNPLSKGCHALIKEGATLVEGVDDIAQQLKGILAFKREEAISSPSNSNFSPSSHSSSGFKPSSEPQLKASSLKPQPLKLQPQKSQAQVPSPAHKPSAVKAEVNTPLAYQGDDPHIHKVLACIGYEPVEFDAIAEHSGLATGDLMACLLKMELQGLLENLGQSYARR